MKIVELDDDVHKKVMIFKHELGHKKVSDTIEYMYLDVTGQLNPSAAKEGDAAQFLTGLEDVPK